MNLLPIKEKNALINEQRNKLLITLGLIVFLSLSSISLILFAIQFSAMAKLDEQENLLNYALKINADENVDSVVKTIKEYNHNIARINLFYKEKFSLTNVFKILTNIMGDRSIKINGINVAVKNNLAQITITGESKSREDLLVLKEEINKIATIRNPSFSQESWLNAKNPIFSLSFELKQ